LTIVLASASPRRRQLLARSGAQVRVHPVALAERHLSGESPASLVQRLADSKAQHALGAAGDADLVLGADTVVVQDGQILGKPETEAEAAAMLLTLSGQTHHVLTGLSLIVPATGRRAGCVTDSAVRMHPWSQAEIEAYVATGSPMDKAGAYGIQDEGINPVDLGAFSDCFTNVMGLPLCRLDQAMRALDLVPPMDLAQDCQSFGQHAVPAWNGAAAGAA
jgi:septum formation protein